MSTRRTKEKPQAEATKKNKIKINKTAIILVVVLLNVLVVYMVGQNWFGEKSEYELTLEEARDFARDELYGRALEKYDEALEMEDNLDLRLEIVDTYEKGIYIGEITSTNKMKRVAEDMLELYKDQLKAYERLCELYLKYNKIEDCATTLMQARDMEISSGKLEAYRNQIRYLYELNYSMYDEITPHRDGVARLKIEDTYTYLGVGGAYSYASLFGEGYAFVKSWYPDDQVRGYLINKTGQRQIYIDRIEETSGVGVAMDKDGNTQLLMACLIDGAYTYVDTQGNDVFGKYAFAGRFRNNAAAVKNDKGEWSLINGTGALITDTVFTDVILNAADECAAKGCIFAKEKGSNTYYMYNLAGQRIGDFACDTAQAFEDSYAAFKKDGLWGYVDTTGKVVIKPQYIDAKSFSCRMAAVKVENGWCFINAKNTIVINELFEDAGWFSESGLCFVKRNGHWSSIQLYYIGE